MSPRTRAPKDYSGYAARALAGQAAAKQAASDVVQLARVTEGRPLLGRAAGARMAAEALDGWLAGLQVDEVGTVAAWRLERAEQGLRQQLAFYLCAGWREECAGALAVARAWWGVVGRPEPVEMAQAGWRSTRWRSN